MAQPTCLTPSHFIWDDFWVFNATDRCWLPPGYFFIRWSSAVHLFTGPKWINPYAIGGINILLPKNADIAVQVPLGLGVNFMVHPQVYLNWQSDYRISIINWENHIQHSFGFVYLFANMKITQAKASTEIMIKDSDGDGILDKVLDGKKTDFKFKYLITSSSPVATQIFLVSISQPNV